MPNLVSLLGIRLQLLLGRPDIPMPAPFEVVDALIDLSVTNQVDERDVFQIQFALGKDSSLDYGLLTTGLLDPQNRVIITSIFGGMPQMLIDGIITQLEISTSNEPGRTTLHVTGEDRSGRLSLQDQNATHPNQKDSDIVMQILKRAGFQPQVTETSDTPDDRERIPTQQCNDLQFVQRLARRNNFVFYIEPTDVPGVNIAYWGPERHDGPHQQPALTMNMGPQTNVDTPINFRFNSLGGSEPEVNIIDPFTHSSIRIPKPTALFASLSSNPAPALRTSISRNAANLSFAQALQLVMRGSVDSASVLGAEGEVDAARYGRALRARRLIDVRGAGRTYDGTYFVRKVVHHIRRRPTGEYKMNFTLTREGLGATSSSVGTQTSD